MHFTKSTGTLSVFTLAIGLAVNGYSQPFLTNGLVAYYPFNGNALDASGNGNNGTVYGATLATDRFGRTNNAYYFDGTSSYIQVPDSSSLHLTNAFTLSAWVWADNFVGSQYMSILSKARPCYGYGYGLDVTSDGKASTGLDNDPALSGGNHNLEVHSTNALVSGRWHQVVGTFDGVNVVTFVDGLQVGLGSWPSGWGPLLVSTYPLYIGHIINAGDNWYYNGELDDIHIYSRALSSNEVQQLYAYESRTPDIASAILRDFTALSAF